MLLPLNLGCGENHWSIVARVIVRIEVEALAIVGDVVIGIDVKRQRQQ